MADNDYAKLHNTHFQTALNLTGLDMISEKDFHERNLYDFFKLIQHQLENTCEVIYILTKLFNLNRTNITFFVSEMKKINGNNSRKNIKQHFVPIESRFTSNESNKAVPVRFF